MSEADRIIGFTKEKPALGNATEPLCEFQQDTSNLANRLTNGDLEGQELSQESCAKLICIADWYDRLLSDRSISGKLRELASNRSST